MTNRKSHTRYRLVPKSMTLDDLEGPLRTLFQNTWVPILEPTTKIWMKIDPHYQRRRCSLMTLDSGNIKFLWIFAGVPWRGGVKRQWSNQKRRFSSFRTLSLWHLRKWGQHYYIILFSPLSPSTPCYPKIHDLEWHRMAWMAILRQIFTTTNWLWELLFAYFL